MAQNCVTNARRPCGLPRVRVAGLCCRAKWSGWDAGLVGCAGPVLVSLGSGPPARLPHARLRLGVVDLEARPGLAATRRHCGVAPQAAWPSGVAQRLATWSAGGVQASWCSCFGRGVRSGWEVVIWMGVAVLDRLGSHSERHNLSGVLSPIRFVISDPDREPASDGEAGASGRAGYVAMRGIGMVGCWFARRRSGAPGWVLHADGLCTRIGYCYMDRL